MKEEGKHYCPDRNRKTQTESIKCEKNRGICRLAMPVLQIPFFRFLFGKYKDSILSLLFAEENKARQPRALMSFSA